MSTFQSNKTDGSESLIAFYNDEPETMTREESLSYWKACAWLRIP